MAKKTLKKKVSAKRLSSKKKILKKDVKKATAKRKLLTRGRKSTIKTPNEKLHTVVKEEKVQKNIAKK